MSFHHKPNKYVKNVTIKVQHLERSLRYYREVIGFQVLEETTTTAKLTTDGENNILTLVQPENPLPKERRATGLYHFAILVPRRSDLANIVFHLIDKGIRIGSSDHLVSEALYLNDPDGNGIEIYVDRDPKTWSWKNEEVMMTVDPLDFKDLLQAGNPEETWNGLPDGTLMGHIHLHVSRLDEAEEFYVKGLGYDIVNRFGDQALFISSGKYHHHIALNTWAGVGVPSPPKNSAGLDSFTIDLPDETVKDQVVSRLEKIGARVTEENEKVVTTDPSGNRIQLEYK
ncbi:VOC family protein [Alteribacillus iranensis]|uniref:Catechol 2,3-dioxygenase n=1 Tax=Alteribacillus iranensis TaxID=930128 RepID=A0A1I2F1C3_9BACI|nr:VOC family protein [Alteribacillus iranensis]SFE99194.1 catechol 2,3-dioxygenase [Alteribacillus iranensis]